MRSSEAQEAVAALIFCFSFALTLLSFVWPTRGTKMFLQVAVALLALFIGGRAIYIGATTLNFDLAAPSLLISGYAAPQRLPVIWAGCYFIASSVGCLPILSPSVAWRLGILLHFFVLPAAVFAYVGPTDWYRGVWDFLVFPSAALQPGLAYAFLWFRMCGLRVEYEPKEKPSSEISRA